MEDNISTKIDLQYAEENVVFLIRDCSIHKDFSFWNLDKQQAEELISCIKNRCKLTWNQFSNPSSRGNGLTPEKPDSDSFKLIDELNSSLEQFTQKHYFHFRTKYDGVFRVFGYQREQYFCITHLDKDGKIHSH